MLPNPADLVGFKGRSLTEGACPRTISPRFATIYAAITGLGFCKAAHEVTDLLQRNFLSSYAVWWMPPFVLNSLVFTASLAWGTAAGFGFYLQVAHQPSATLQVCSPAPPLSRGVAALILGVERLSSADEPGGDRSSIPPSHWEAAALPMWGGNTLPACAKCTTPRLRPRPAYTRAQNSACRSEGEGVERVLAREALVI